MFFSDLRLFLKVGDKVCIQVNDMSSAEKRRIKKVLGADAPTIPSYMATLAYFGSEKRPKSATVTPVTSTDLKEYLKKIELVFFSLAWVFVLFESMCSLTPVADVGLCI